MVKTKWPRLFPAVSSGSRQFPAVPGSCQLLLAVSGGSRQFPATGFRQFRATGFRRFRAASGSLRQFPAVPAVLAVWSWPCIPSLATSEYAEKDMAPSQKSPVYCIFIHNTGGAPSYLFVLLGTFCGDEAIQPGTRAPGHPVTWPHMLWGCLGRPPRWVTATLLRAFPGHGPAWGDHHRWVTVAPLAMKTFGVTTWVVHCCCVQGWGWGGGGVVGGLQYGVRAGLASNPYFCHLGSVY